jgi:hypothetical protein
VKRRIIATTFLALWFGAVAHGQQAPTSEQEARAALERFFSAWNQADNTALRRTLNFPFVTVAGGRVMIAETPEDFSTDFERMRDNEGWHHSTLDEIEVTRASDAQAHCEVTYSRYKEDGTRYRTGSGLYVITLQDGHWGMQLRAFAPVVEP